MHPRLSTIEKILQRKTQLANDQPIYIRELIVYPNKNNFTNVGEFDPELVQSKNINITHLESETEEKLIYRLSKFINNLASRAAFLHIKDNFVDEHLSFERLNHITRLSLPEYALYPAEKRGPLTLNGLNKLLQEIEFIAQWNPENLHLLLGTVPVRTIHDQVHNICIYVECGKNPRLHLVVKALPASRDLRYPGTTNSNFSSAFLPQELMRELRLLSEQLVEDLTHHRPEVSLINVMKLKDLCQKSVFLTPHKELVDILNLVHSRIEQDFYLTNHTGWNEAKTDALLLEDEIGNFIDTHNAKQQAQISCIAPFSFSDRDHPNVNVIYGGNFECRTAGGALFLVAVDICLDHHLGVAKNCFLHQLKHARLNNDRIIPTHISQLITSNTVSLSKKSLLSESIVQADPDNVIVCIDENLGFSLPERKEKLPDPFFGSHLKMKIYPIYELPTYKPSLKNQIHQHNHFINKLNALRIYRLNYSSLRTINQKILTHILGLVLPHVEYNPLLINYKILLSQCLSFKKAIEVLEQLHASLFTYFPNRSLFKKIAKEMTIALSLLKEEQKNTDEADVIEIEDAVMGIQNWLNDYLEDHKKSHFHFFFWKKENKKLMFNLLQKMKLALEQDSSIVLSKQELKLLETKKTLIEFVHHYPALSRLIQCSKNNLSTLPNLKNNLD